MNKLLIGVGIVVAMLAAAGVGWFLWLDHEISPTEKITQKVASVEWVAIVKQVASPMNTGNHGVTYTSLLAYRVADGEKSATEFLAVSGAEKFGLRWQTPETLEVSCAKCEVFLHYMPPAGLHVVYDVPDPRQLGKMLSESPD